MIERANGSCYIERGKIKIVCAVHGPRQQARNAVYSPNAKVTCEVKYAPFACAKRHGYVRDSRERDLSTQVAEALVPSIITTLFPKSEIAIYITILEEDGELATLAAALSAASAAVADAHIECRDLVAAASVVLRNNAIIVDTAQDEDQDEDVNLIIAYMPNREEITFMQMDGSLKDVSKMDSLLQACVYQAKVMNAVMSKTLLEQ